MVKKNSPILKPEPSAPKWCKDVRAVALVFGLRLYEQRPQLLKQLAAVKSATTFETFPAKVKGYWPRAGVAAWAERWVELQKGARGFSVRPSAKPVAAKLQDSEEQVKAATGKPNLQPSTSNPQPTLPAQTKPAADGELFLNESPAERLARRMDRLEDMYLNPENYETKISQWEVAELRQHRPQIWAKAEATQADGNENIGGGNRGVAAWIQNNFPGVVCHHMNIQRWRSSEYLPGGCKENFPPPDDGGRFKRSLIAPWVEKYLLKRTHGQDLGLDIQQERDKAELEQIAHDRFVRERERGEWVRVATVAACIEGFATRDAEAITRLIEDAGGLRAVVQAAAMELGLTPDQLRALDDKVTAGFVRANDALKTGYEQTRGELEKQIEDQRQQIAGKV